MQTRQGREKGSAEGNSKYRREGGEGSKKNEKGNDVSHKGWWDGRLSVCAATAGRGKSERRTGNNQCKVLNFHPHNAVLPRVYRQEINERMFLSSKSPNSRFMDQIISPASFCHCDPETRYFLLVYSLQKKYSAGGVVLLNTSTNWSPFTCECS